MPRFVCLPVPIEAHQYNGHLHEWPEQFRLAVRGHKVGGIVEVMTGDGVRQCKHGDWVVAGPDGTFSVQRAATFETWFTPLLMPRVEQIKAPSSEGRADRTAPIPARADTRRKAHA